MLELFSFWNIMLWSAVNALILLISSQLLRALLEKRFGIEKRRLDVVALALAAIFLVMVCWFAYESWMSLQP